MKRRKRLAASILAAMMIVSSLQFPGGTVFAVEETESDAGGTGNVEDGDNDIVATVSADDTGGTSEAGRTEEAPADVEDTPEEDGENDVLNLGGGENEPAQISGNNLQVSGNDFTGTEEQETLVIDALEGVYQFGGAPSARPVISVYSIAAYSEAEEYIYQQMLLRNEKIDISQYNIPAAREALNSLVSGVLNEHPDLYFVNQNCSAETNGTILTVLIVTYDSSYDDAAFRGAVEAALATVEAGMSDLEKAIILHDYLAINCEYDKERLEQGELPMVSHSAYGSLVNRIAVCDGYALAYKYLLNREGINCYMVTSSAMNHAWNLIELGGEYYQVDVTWDDPTWDRIGRAKHDYMFCSDAVFRDASHNHRDWSVTSGSEVVNYEASSTLYDSAFWTDVSSPIVFSGSDCYYTSFNESTHQGVIKKGSLSNIENAGTEMKEIGSWTVWGGGGWWTGAFSGLFQIEDRLYYNSKDNICSIALDGSDQRVEYTPDTSGGYIYGSALCRGKVLYTLHQDPNETGKETVLEAEIAGPDVPEDPDKPLDMENLTAEYTTLADEKVSSAAGGRPKLLIFYRDTCWNCRQTIGSISDKIADFGGADVCAIEIDRNPKETVAAFRDRYGCDEIIFSYDTTAGNADSMWAYARLAGIVENNSVTTPVICYIDANNRLQFVTEGYKTADEVLDSLKKYCKYAYEALKTYTITYVLDGGVNNSANPSTYTEQSDTVILQDAVRDGYQFDGWYSDPQYTVRVTQIEKGSTGDITLYAKWNEISIRVTRPNVTTYKVGQPIDVTGGKITYQVNGKPKTKNMTVEMLDGFDSARPGICTVTVTYAGYTARFDTLIVEEPRLTASFGQALKDVSMPQNEYGAYAWQKGVDVEQKLEKAGGYNFAAVFTPKDKERFQELTDIQVKVKVQSTLGEQFQVAFKNSAFTYNGTEQEPKVVVSVADSVLMEGQDYELSYRNNKNAGEAVVVVQGVNYYSGTIEKTFVIQPAPLVIRVKDKRILIGERIPEKADYEYEVFGLMTGDSLLTEPDITCGILSTATAGVYDIISQNADAGENYSITYENGSLFVASERVSCVVDFDVQGHGSAPADDIDVRVGSTIARPTDPAAQGYRFDGWYRDAACTRAWNFDTDIVQSSMTLYAKWLHQEESNGFAMQEISDVYYTGKACKPAVSVYDGETLLKSGRDYQIKYYNNTNANKGGKRKTGNGEGASFDSELPYVEITGKGNYTDRNHEPVKVNFNILRAPISDNGKDPSTGIKVKFSGQLAKANKTQKPFSSIKYVKSMKLGRDYTLGLMVVNARDQSGKDLPKNLELEDAAVPAGYEGEFLLKIQGQGNYEGCIEKTVYVADRRHLIKNAKITLGKNLKNVEFDDKPVELIPAEHNADDVFTVKYGNTFLKYKKDYDVSYRGNDRVGKAELIITGMGEYAGEKTAGFRIRGRSFKAKNVRIDGLEDKFYTGKGLTQNDVTLTYMNGTDAEKKLTYGEDYTISYAKNINKGTASIIFKGVDRAGFSGSFKKTFKINAADIAEVKQDQGMNALTFRYCKAGVKPVDEILLTNEAGFKLKKGKDYSLRYVNNKEVADVADENPPTVIVKGKGNYTGVRRVYFRIVKADLGADAIKVKTAPIAYNDRRAADYIYKPSVKLMDGKTPLRAGKDYEIVYLKNTQADYIEYLRKLENRETVTEEDMPRAVITEHAGAAYKLDASPMLVPLSIYRTKLAKKDLTVEIDPEKSVYTGSQVLPPVKVYYGNGRVLLEEGKDYTISYGKNKKSGKNKGSVTISGIAPQYGGDVTVKFQIYRKPIIYPMTR